MIVKFDPNGNVTMTLGRKTEAIDYLERFVERGEKDTERYPTGSMGIFNRETDVASTRPSSRSGTWIKASEHTAKNRIRSARPHGIAVDAQAGLVYVADRANLRIQVYDTDLNFKKTITGVAMPWTVQVTPKYIYSGDGTGKI